MNKRIAKSKLDESIEILGRLGLAHIFFILLILPWMFGDWRAEGHLIYIVVSAVLLFILPRVLGPLNPIHNLSIGSVYIGLVILEFILCGIPTVLVETQSQISKGVMFEMLMALLPWLYVGVRISLLVPLVVLIYRSKTSLNFNRS